jgi:phosphohistidine phosphatase
MNLYLIRHADAARPEACGELDDADRPLTNNGKAQCKALAAALLGRGVSLNQVVSSPLLRARQTMEVLLEHWPLPAPEQLTCKALAPDGRAKKITRFLLGLSGENVALVGHMPDLAEYAGWLVGAKKAQVNIAKAGVAFIRFDGSPDKGEGSLVWLITPEWCDPASGRVNADQ